MKIFVTGAAGFIGSNLVDRLLLEGYRVVGYDNFSTGQKAFLSSAMKHNNFELIEGDLLNYKLLSSSMEGCKTVFHFSANADVRFGIEHPRKDLEQNTIATFNVLEAMRANKAETILFSSTGSVYGEAPIIPTPENAFFPIQTSLYGASKLACEGLISAYVEGFGIKGVVFRFVSIMGERYTHGHVFDFYKQLLKHPTTLHILGNGKQKKSYLHIQDCVQAMMIALVKAPLGYTVLNLGTDEYCEVNDSVKWISESLGISPRLTYQGGERGWIGDNPFILLECSRMRSFGWEPTVSIKDCVIKTLKYLKDNKWVLDQRG